VLLLLILFLTVGGGRDALAQTGPPATSDALYARLLKALRQIHIIDNHAHPALPGDRERAVLSFALSGANAQESATLPLRLRPNNLELLPAFRALYGYTHADLSLEHLRELAALKRKARADADTSYFNSVLDKAGISISLANRVGMANAPLDRQRFKWVPSVDAYLFPLNNTVYKKQHPALQSFFSAEERVLERYLALVETTRPRRFDAYLRFVRESVNRLRADGAIAIAFEVAALRSLSVDDPSLRQARRIYERYRNTTEVPEDEYRKLQDFLFRYLLREVTTIGLPVQIHTGGGGHATLRLSNANPLLLENLVTDQQYRNTKFVLLYGGYPFIQEAKLLAGKPNVFLDTSGLSLRLYPEEFAQIVKSWLSFYPEKIVFGTDATGVSDLIDTEEAYWLATEGGRHALALALSDMVREGRCDETEALRLARLLLRDNAAKLYGLP
jgi:predicted TIM-barrel fold metal-dependent hydrolase